MFRKTMELTKKIYGLKYDLKAEECGTKALRETIEKLQKQAREKNEHQIAMHLLDLEQAKNKIRKDMEKSLIESDLKRVEAVAKLNTYIDMDTKDDRKHTMKMLEKAIEGLSNQKINVVK